MNGMESGTLIIQSSPCLIVRNAAGLIGFLRDAFQAEEIAGSRQLREDNTIDHVEVKIGDTVVMMIDAPKGAPPMPGFFHLYVENAHKVLLSALHAGGREITSATSRFLGDVSGRIADPFGNIWWIQDIASKKTQHLGGYHVA